MVPQTNVLVISRIVILTVLLAYSILAYAHPIPNLPGTYTSLRYNPESGDLSGYEVRIIPTDHGLKAVVQVAEGSAGTIYIVDVLQKDYSISFDVPLASDVQGKFVGTIVCKGLKGVITYPSGLEEVLLRRGKSYWE